MSRLHLAVALSLFALCYSMTAGSPADAPPAAEPAVVAAGPSASALDMQEEPAEPAVPETPAPTQLPADRLTWHLATPRQATTRTQELLEAARAEGNRTQANILERGLRRIETIRRPTQWALTLEDALHLALQHSYDIEVQRYNPAIETTRVVEAQGAFDAVLFSNLTKNIQDRPSGSQLAATDLDLLLFDTGVRKILPSGMTVSASYEFERTSTSLSFQQLNPQYFSQVVMEMRQPLLRGFGVDFNRSLILIAQNNRRISEHAFAREVRDKLREVEELYWRLLQARHSVVTTARVLAEFETIYEYLEARRDFDIIEVQLAATRANLEASRADFEEVKASVFDAEDRLITAINPRHVNLADETEIVPVDIPQILPLRVDPLAEVQSALDHRREIREQELRVSTARIAVARAKNFELPTFDLTLRYAIDGLGVNWDDSFDQVTNNDFNEYFIGVSFELPIGNRAARAAHLRARLEHDQAGAGLRSVIEGVILDTNLAVRRVATTYSLIAPNFETAEAREREVESIVARQERKDFNTLNSELGARQSLSNARRALMATLVDYNLAIIDLERAKGTLLIYNNVVVPRLEGD